MAYKAKIKTRFKNHPVYKWPGIRHLLKKPGDKTRMPLPVQTYPSPRKGKKIEHRYDNAMLKDLLGLNPSASGKINILRVNNFLFNAARNRHLVKAKKKGTQHWKDNYVPYPLPEGQYVIGENVLMDGDTVTVLEERGKWVRIAPQIATLYEIEISSGKVFKGGLHWRVMNSSQTNQTWMEKAMIERVS